MTSIANPLYKYYKKLEGTWKDEAGSCEATLNSGAGIYIQFSYGKLASSYSVLESIQLMLNQGGMMGMVYTIHEGEELKITINDRTVYEGDKTVYRVSDAWYGNEKLHLEMMDLNDGHIENIVLTRIEPEDTPVPEGEYQCSCGYRGKVGRFCPECGREIS